MPPSQDPTCDVVLSYKRVSHGMVDIHSTPIGSVVRTAPYINFSSADPVDVYFADRVLRLTRVRDPLTPDAKVFELHYPDGSLVTFSAIITSEAPL